MAYGVKATQAHPSYVSTQAHPSSTLPKEAISRKFLHRFSGNGEWRVNLAGRARRGQGALILLAGRNGATAGHCTVE